MTTKTRRTPNATFGTLGTSTAAVVNRIVAVWNTADDSARSAGTAWYPTAFEHATTIANNAGISVENAAAVISHLSPKTRWVRNIAGAYALVETGSAPRCIATNVARAMVGLGSSDPGATFGPAAHKTRAFYANILGDTQRVTIDTWAYRLAMGTTEHAERNMQRVGVYAALEYAYQLAAHRVGVEPSVMQATTWIAARNGRTV